MRAEFYKRATTELKAAGLELIRRNAGSDVYRGPTRRPVVVSRNLKDKNIFLRILKQAGVRHG